MRKNDRMKTAKRILMILVIAVSVTSLPAVSHGASSRDGSDAMLIKALKGSKKAWKKYTAYYKRYATAVTKHTYGRKRVTLTITQKRYLGTLNFEPYRETLRREFAAKKNTLNRLIRNVRKKAGLKKLTVNYVFVNQHDDLVISFTCNGAKASSSYSGKGVG